MMLGNSYNGEQQVIETGSLRANGDGDIGIGGGNGGMQLKKGPWTAAEDAILTEYVRKHGEGNWNAVQRNTGLARCGKSCRLRWANHLRPNLKKGAFSPEEERIIVELHAQLGNKWARMAAQLPGRTDNEIKNYWNTRVKRRHRQGLPLYPPDVQPQHKNQNQQFSISQTNSHSHHHSYHSLPTTPTTPTSSFSFQTIHTTPSTPTSTSAPHHHYTQHQLHHYQFPPCHSPTPPPALSPTPPPLSPNLHSPTFPTLTLFDSNAHNPNNSNNNNTNNNNLFNMPRTPPILQTPLRFKRFHSDPSINTDVAASNNNAINNNNNNNNGGIGTSNHPNGSFSLPYSPFVQTTQSPLPSPQANNNNNNTNSTSKLFSIPSFSSNYIEFNSGSTSSNFRTQFEKDCVPSNGSVFSLKQELPSSQLLSQNNNGGNSGMTFDNTKVTNHDNVSSSGSGLLDDLLEEAQAMANNYGESSRSMNSVGVGSMEEKRGFSGFNPWNCSGSANSSSGMKPKEEPGAQMDNMHEDLSKLLNVIPSMQVPEWYNDNGEASNCQSSVVTDDNLGLEMQQIASMFSNNNSGQVRNTNSCSCDNLPGLC